MRDYKLYLQDILGAIESIQAFVQGMSLDDFRADDKTSSAVLRKFESIGEAAKHIPDDLRQLNSRIPWTEMAGMRDRLIHAYFGVDFQLVWETIQERIPEIKSHIQSMLSD